MKAVMLDVPKELLEERRRKGHDRFDEMWDGVLHMVPQPSSEHQSLASDLHLALGPVGRERGMKSFYETGLYRPGATQRDYRVPDMMFALPAQISPRGVDGACELVIEILSPDDETYEKLPFYAELGVREVFVVKPGDRTFELYVLRGGRYILVSPDESGTVRSQVLGVAFTTIPGPKLRVAWAGGAAEI